MLDGNGVVRGAEIEVYRRDRTKKWVLMSLRAVRDINGDTLLNEGTVEDISDRKVAEEWVQFLAYYDALTGLPNRTLLRDRLSQALASARRRKDKVALLFLDLDRFKIVNDSLGHSVGDLLLKEVAARLKRWAREQDTVARLGGDEFLIVLTDVKDIPGAAVAAERLMDAMIAEFVVQGHPLMVSCSLGISIFPEHVRAGDKGSHSGRFGPEPVIHQREPRWRGRGKNFTAVSKLVLPRVPCVLRGIWILLRD